MTETGNNPGFRGASDCFHNGHHRLDAVDEQHLIIARDLPPDDKITGRILETMG